MDTLTQEATDSVEKRSISEALTSKTEGARSAMQIAEELELTEGELKVSENDDKSKQSIEKQSDEDISALNRNP